MDMVVNAAGVFLEACGFWKDVDGPQWMDGFNHSGFPTILRVSLTHSADYKFLVEIRGRTTDGRAEDRFTTSA